MIDTTPLLGYGRHISPVVKERIGVLEATEDGPVHKINQTSRLFTLGQPAQDVAYIRLYRALLLARNPGITLSDDGGRGEEAAERTIGRKPVTTELLQASYINLATPPGSHAVYSLLMHLAFNDPTPERIKEVFDALNSSEQA